MTQKALFGFWILLLTYLFTACGDMNFSLPYGPEGEKGTSAYEIWKQQVAESTVNWPKDQVTIADFMVYIKGPKGDKGDNGRSAYEIWKDLIADGKAPNPHHPREMWPADRNTEADFWDYLTGRNGKTPHIGDNGNWWVGDIDTKVYAYGVNGNDGKNGKSTYEVWKNEVETGNINWPKDQTDMVAYFRYLKGEEGKEGKEGRDGVTPHIGPNGNWWLYNTDTNVPAKGQDGRDGVAGTTPHIGNNGNWWVGSADTNIPARGQDGNNGSNGSNGADGRSPYIGTNNNWWIGDSDTGMPATGEKGAAGESGKSAYELWLKDLTDGKLTHPQTGASWPQDEKTLEDFWRYHKGARGDKGDKGDSGNDGLSAYEVWVKEVKTGNLDNPKNPGTKWLANEHEIIDFYRYLTGLDGKDGTNGSNGTNGTNGQNGKSAYEIWKKDLADNCGVAGKELMNHKVDPQTPWDCDKNSMDDFWEYLRGKDGEDGADGKDGKPGEPGSPGATVTIINGIPNVIAQYSQSDYGEYVRVSDGGVRYIVYDDNGNPAPGAIVKGMPGIPSETFTAGSDGSFIIPRDKLPYSEDLSWGIVTSVEINGITKQSASNTYVPNRVETRLKLYVRKEGSAEPDSYDPHLEATTHQLYFTVQRQLNPGAPWIDLPLYLPEVTSLAFKAYRVTDKDDPSSIDETRPLTNSNYTRSQNIFFVLASRYVIQNPMNNLNNMRIPWDRQDNFFSVIQIGSAFPNNTYYGTKANWNGISKMAPMQIAPFLKTLKLYKIDSTGRFLAAEGTLSYDHIEMDKWYHWGLRNSERTVGGRTFEYLDTEAFPRATAEAMKISFVQFTYNDLNAGAQVAISGNTLNNAMSKNTPSFNVNTPYLNSEFSVSSIRGYLHAYTLFGRIRQKADGHYYMVPSRPGVPEVKATYVP